ncbi:MAG: alpha/beta hydrolase [Actinomycetota bacterium]|nr:alpha/beta hydrolase [Actinomycetota bacterium]
MLRRSTARAIALLVCAGLGLIGIESASGLTASASPSTSSPTLHVQYASAAGTTFAFAQLGSGPALILLNGTGSPMNEWDPALLAALARSHRVTVFDYPGIGLSARAPSKWTFSNAADWVAAFAKVLSPKAPVDVVGWSMGGFIAQQLAIRHPEVVRQLILAATNPGGPQAKLGPRWVQQLDSASQESDKAYLQTNYPHSTDAQAAGRAFLHRLSTAVESGAYPPEQVPAATYRAMVAAEDPWLRSEANSRALRTLSIPTLVITGASDVVTPAANSRLLARIMPGARLVLVPGAGHSFLFQNPQRTARTFDAFLAASPVEVVRQPSGLHCRLNHR